MQILNDLSDGLVPSANPSLDGTAKTVSVQGTSVDMFNYESATQAIVVYGAPAAAVTGMTAQVEEWDGTSATTWTAIANMIGASVTTGPTAQVLGPGLRTYRYARVNVITAAVSTNANVPMGGVILGMPRSSASKSGVSKSPSS